MQPHSFGKRPGQSPAKGMAPSSAAHGPERSKVEQIVVEFFAKSLHIILEARIPALGGECDCLGSSASSSTTSGPKTRDRWFNLALGDCTVALENFEPWRRSSSDPMVVDIVLDHSKWAKGGAPSAQGSSTSTTQVTVLERWTVQFEQGRRSSSSPVSRGASGASGAKEGSSRNEPGADEAQERQNFVEEWSGWRQPMARVDLGQSASKGGLILPAHITEVSAVYKRTVIMLRSLYSTCRLLPAYRMFRVSSSPTNCCDFTLNYRVLSSATPLSEHEKQDMSVYRFTPVETAFGRMCLSVAYQLTTSVIALEVVPSIIPRIIPDYVGSPTTDPLKRFTEDPHSLPISGTQISRGMQMISVPSSLQNSPPGFDIGRRHSWSGRVHQVQPALQPPSSPSYRLSRSPSPLFHPSPPYPPPLSPFSQKHPCSDVACSPISSPLSSADHPSGISAKIINPSQPISIANRYSPPFSPSPSPSPPTLYKGSDPVSIPKSSHSRGSKLLAGDAHQRSRNSLPPISPSSKMSGVLRRSSSESPRCPGQPVSHAHQSRSFESPIPLQVFHDDRAQQVWTNERSGPLYGQAQTTLSRSSSRTALADEGEDEEFSCPFAVDDVDAEEKRSRSGSSGLTGEVPESSRGPQQLSHDAAVGALILMLKSAAPLDRMAYPGAEAPFAFGALNEREPLSDRIPASLAGVGRPPSSPSSETVPATKTVAKALEELHYYKELVHTRNAEVARGTSSGKGTLPG